MPIYTDKMSAQKLQLIDTAPYVKIKVEELSDGETELSHCTFCGQGYENEIELQNHAKKEHIDYTISGMDLVPHPKYRRKKNSKLLPKASRPCVGTENKQLRLNFGTKVKLSIGDVVLEDRVEDNIHFEEPVMESQQYEREDETEYFELPEVKVEIVEISNEYDFKNNFEASIKIEKLEEDDIDNTPSYFKGQYDFTEQKFNSCTRNIDQDLKTGEKQNILQKLRKVNGLCIRPITNKKYKKKLITYTCHICPYESKTESAYINHLQTHNSSLNNDSATALSQDAIQTSDKSYGCDMCDRKFTRRNHLNTHKVTHTGDKPYSCNVCFRKFSQKSHLTTHQSTHTGGKPFHCIVCERKFSRKCDLNTHSRIHVGEKKFDCDVCGKKFLRKSNLESHSRTHTGDKPYSCDICHQKFSQNGNLTAHKIIHTGSRPFACDLCERKFSLKSQLKLHIRIHAEGKLFSCDICEHRFSTKCYLEKHRVIHTGEKPYRCDICGRRFTRKTHLMRHNRTHTGEKPFGCDICGLKLSDRSTLIAHRRKLHAIDQCNYMY